MTPCYGILYFLPHPLVYLIFSPISRGGNQLTDALHKGLGCERFHCFFPKPNNRVQNQKWVLLNLLHVWKDIILLSSSNRLQNSTLRVFSFISLDILWLNIQGYVHIDVHTPRTCLSHGPQIIRTHKSLHWKQCA